MLITKRRPAGVGEIPTEGFLASLALTQGALASVTAATALIRARVFGNTAEFRLNVQRRSDLRAALASPRERDRIARARPLKAA